MMGSRIVALITDFGQKDSYVAEIKAVLLRNAASLTIIDVCHDLNPGDVKSASYMIWRMCKVLPKGSIILSVVDPGVGSDRQAVIVRNNGFYFVAPDNGILSRAIDWSEPIEVRKVEWDGQSVSYTSDHENRELSDRSPLHSPLVKGKLKEGSSSITASSGKGDACSNVSVSFHGRDLFAPVAAKLATGTDFKNLGRESYFMDTFPPSPVKYVGGKIIGEVIHIDVFGNIITNITNQCAGFINIKAEVTIRKALYYTDPSAENIFWIEGSDGNIEIAANAQRANEILGVKREDSVVFTPLT